MEKLCNGIPELLIKMKVFFKKLISKSLSEKTKRRLKKIYRFKKSGVLLQQVLRYFWAIPFVQRYIKFGAEHFWPVDDRKIVFATFSHQFNCNPGAIAQTLVARNSQCQLVFENIPELLKKFQNNRNTVPFLREQCQWSKNAKIITYTVL